MVIKQRREPTGLPRKQNSGKSFDVLSVLNVSENSSFFKKKFCSFEIILLLSFIVLPRMYP